MTRIFAISIAIAAMLLSSQGFAGSSTNQCTHSAAEYATAVRHFEGQVAEAKTAALANPLYESDVAYYASVLADARACLKSLAPITTASR